MDATTDPERIRAWWQRWPQAMIGMPTGPESGVWVLDVDQHGEDGEESLVNLRNGREMPDTVEAMTPSGGRHIYFRLPEGSEIRNSAGKLGPGLDVRGDGGYVIVPPSGANGHAYQWEGSSDPTEGVRAAEAPPWLLALVSATPKQDVGQHPIVEALKARGLYQSELRDGRHRITCPWAEQHTGGDTSGTVFMEANFSGYSSERFVCQHAHCAGKRLQHLTDFLSLDRRLDTGAAEVRFPFLLAHELGTDQQTAFRIEGWLEEGGIGLLYAPKDTFKSFVAVDWHMAVVTGAGWHGFETQKGAGAYIAGEGNRGLRRRFSAWCIRHGYELATLPLAVSTMPMQVLDPENISQWAEHIERVQDLLGEAVEYITVDTLATNFGPGDENKPGDMARFLAHLRIYLQAEFNCTILVVHHTGKEISLGARGGSAIEGNADAVFTLKREGEPDERRVILSCKHIKDEDRPPDMHLQAQVVEIGSTDRYGDPITSLALAPDLDEREILVLNNLKAGKSQRQIADLMGVKSKTSVARIERRLRNLRRLP